MVLQSCSYTISVWTYSLSSSYQHKNYCLHIEESHLPQLSETARQDSASVRQIARQASTSGSK